MSLGMDLDHALLRSECPHCGQAIEQRGTWFKSVARYVCAGCGAVVRMTYDVKLRLFAAATKPTRAFGGV